MNQPGNALVIDASVAVKLFIPEEYSDSAIQIFKLLEAPDPAGLFVPDLFYIECANVFRTRVKFGGMSGDEARKAHDILLGFPLERVPTTGLSASALALSLQYDLSVYDACYLALASLIGSPLVTADRKFARKMSGSDLPVIWIGDW